MKNTETDKELADLIRETLDNHEENYILGSWENFDRKRKRRRRAILWIRTTGIAAAILLGWLGYRLFYNEPIVTGDKNLPEHLASMQVFSGQVITVKERYPSEGRLSAKNSKGSVPVQKNSDQQSETGVAGEKSENTADDHPAHSALPGVTGSDISTEKNLAENKKEITDKSENGSSAGNRVAENKSSDNGTTIPGAGITQSGNSFESKSTDDLSESRRPSKFRFGVSVAPGVTSTGTLSAFSYSGGVNAEYALTGTILISTGLQVEHQSVLNEDRDSPTWIPPGKTQADLVDLDLPLNLTWKFLSRKSSSYYLAGGISSVVYLSQKYISTTYTQKMVQSVDMKEGMPSVNYQLENVSSTVEEKEQAFSAFDFAGRVNIIFGFEQKFGSRLFLHLEPYVKIPVTELASRDLRFTTSGISCKVSF